MKKKIIFLIFFCSKSSQHHFEHLTKYLQHFDEHLRKICHKFQYFSKRRSLAAAPGGAKLSSLYALQRILTSNLPTQIKGVFFFARVRRSMWMNRATHRVSFGKKWITLQYWVEGVRITVLLRGGDMPSDAPLLFGLCFSVAAILTYCNNNTACNVVYDGAGVVGC